MEEHHTVQTPPSDTLLNHALERYFEEGYSLALWRRPNQPVTLVAAPSLVRQSELTIETSAPGFAFSSFRPDGPLLFLPAEEMIIFTSSAYPQVKGRLANAASESLQKHKTVTLPYHVSPQRAPASIQASHYHHLVQQCAQLVRNGSFEKLVPSRCSRVELPPHLSITALFHRLCEQYPNAMVSLFSSPEFGTWMGATPELLVSVEDGKTFNTVAVAGTQPYVEGMDLKSVTWTQKEIEEQALVERYIISCFKKIRLREYDELGPRTVVAGNLLHLKTTFTVDMLETNFPQLGSVMLKLLHPTSAVCGSPLQESLTFLKESEGYDRQFYSGYLGPVNMQGNSHLFVNLRCMQLFKEAAILYAGAGVIADSDPEKEWHETEMKMNTLLRVLRA